jgi:methionyl-tRNA formyltransferase
MNVALIGSVSSSWFALDALIRTGVEITAVCGLDESRAERISDYRSLRPLAERAGIPYLPFVKVGAPEVEAFLRGHRPDLLWVIGLSQLIPDRLVRIARHGGVGFHPTMLPKGRGRAPVAWTILRNERAAANLFFLADEPDAGDIIIQREVPVLPDDYSEDLIQRTNEVLADAIIEIAPLIKSGNLPRIPQDHSKATHYKKRTPADGLVDWSQSTEQIYRLIRAAGRPYPGAFSFAGSAKVTIWRARPAGASHLPARKSPRPGEIIDVDRHKGVLTATADGGLWLTEIQVEGGEALEVGTILATPQDFTKPTAQ